MTRPIPPDGAQLLDRFPEAVQELMLQLRDRVLALAPNAHEIILDVGYTVSVHYGPDDRPGNAVVYIAGYSKHTNLGFFAGAELPDPQQLLTGTGARMRHIRISSPDEADAAWLDEYLKAAFAAAGPRSDAGDGRTTVRTMRRRPTPGRLVTRKV